MKKNLFSIHLLFMLFSCNNDSVTIKNQESNNTKILEDEYITKKHQYIKRFRKIKLLDSEIENNIHKPALLVLEELLHVILKDAVVKDFASQSKMNTTTLFMEFGVDMIDGLTIRFQDTINVFFTSKYLFDSFLKSEKYMVSLDFKDNAINSFENLSTQDLSNIFTGIYHDDAAVHNFSSIKINTHDGIIAYGLLGLSTNGDTPFLPNELYVLVLKDKYIYTMQVVNKDYNKPFINVIPECIYVNDDLYTDSIDQNILNKSQILTGELSNNEIKKVYFEDYKKYCECYKNNLHKHKQFKEIEKKLTTMVDYVLKEIAN